MWQGLMWGAVLSIPIGIAINLLSPVISRRIDSRTKESASKRAERDTAFKARAATLAKDRAALYIELLETLLRVAFFTALFGVLSGTAFFLGQLVPYMGLITSLLFALGQLGALIG